MADKSVSELIAAKSVTPTDLFVLEQNGTAKKLTGQILENWLVSFADGHGGIQSIVKKSTSGLIDTYRITLADTTTFDFVVNNGRSINAITKTKTSGLVDTYTIQFNDSTTSTFDITNGAKGDKGDNQYVWIKYASQKPTASSHSFGDVADNWIGIYSGASATAPTDWTQYEWFQIKGEKGDTGEPARLTDSAVEYQVGDSGTIIPSGAWSESVPVVAQGRYMWTRTTTTFNTGSSVVSYSVSRMGIDGTGSVSSVAGISPEPDGNVPLAAENVGALPSTGGTMTGQLNMNGQKLFGLNAPTKDDEAATKKYVDTAKPDLTGYATESYVDTAVTKAAPRNLLDNSDFRNPVKTAGLNGYHGTTIYACDRWKTTTADANLTSEGLFIKSGNGVQQVLASKYVGKTLTLACGNSLGEICCASAVVTETDGTHKWILNKSTKHAWIGVLQNDQGTLTACVRQDKDNVEYPIEWAALYEGAYTAATLPEYRSKGYGAELAECQRYYQKLSSTNYSLGYKVSGDERIMIPLSIPTMRIINPSITGSVDAFSQQGWQGAKAPTTCQKVTAGYMTYLPIVSGFTFNSGSCFIVRGTIEISADL
jgi:hypothetical protein